MSLSDTKHRALHNKEQSSDLELTDGDGLGVMITPKSVITFDGLKVTCLLNPAMYIGDLVRIKSIISSFNRDYKITKQSP